MPQQGPADQHSDASPDDTPLRCLAINCTLKASGPSSTQVLLDQVIEELQASGVTCSSIRAAALDIRPGVTDDEGAGDAWPSIRDDLLASDILLLGTPIWLGNPSSVCRRVLERCDAFISQTDDDGRMVTFGKTAGVVVTGNEDGAHNVIAQLYQGLGDCGFTIPTMAATYWVGEAMGSVDYRELDEPPEAVAETVRMMATNLVHVARLLEAHPYPAPGSSLLP